MGIFDNVTNTISSLRNGGRAGTQNERTGTVWTTPWQCRDEDGLYGGWNKEAWLYWEVPVNPLLWEDPATRLDRAQVLEGILAELGDLETDHSATIPLLSAAREVHVLSVSWEEPGKPAPGVPDDLAEFQAACLDFLIPQKAVVLGVKLRADNAVLTARYKGVKGLLEQVKETSTKALGEGGFDREAFANDRERVEKILKRAGAKPPREQVLAQIESWYNLGRGSDALIQVADDALYIDNFDVIEIAAVNSFKQKVFEAPDAQWILDAVTHASGPKVVSIRAELQTPATARNRARRAQRRIRAQIEEEQATGDLERMEDTDAWEQAQETERFITLGQECLLSSCSILMARRVSSDTEETYADELRQVYGIEMRPLLLRQLEALEETLPCATKRVNPFLQDLSISMVAHSGILGWSSLGDRTGLFTGLADPDYTPVWLDVAAAPASNKPPAMGIFGDPGSGKTYLMQLMATQAALAGQQVVFINPKGFSTLSPFAELVGGSVVKMSELEDERSGYFDPFRFAEPEMAAEIATNFILQVLGNTGVAGMGFTAEQELHLGSGLKRGARAGAQSVLQALEHVEDDSVKRMVHEQLESSALFGIGIAKHTGERHQARQGLTLIEFDRKLDFPEKGKPPTTWTRSERISLAAIRIVTRASMEILVGSGGGMLMVDEAWTYLSSSEGLASLQQIGREGRSLNLLPVFATQRVDDLVREGVDMESYLSRVMVMKLNDPREATAAFTLCGLEPTDARINWLRSAGPRPEQDGQPGRPSMGVLRDLNGRHAPVYVGPVPPRAHQAFTTNPAERAIIENANARRADNATPQPEPTPTTQTAPEVVAPVEPAPVEPPASRPTPPAAQADQSQPVDTAPEPAPEPAVEPPTRPVTSTQPLGPDVPQFGVAPKPKPASGGFGDPYGTKRETEEG